MLSDSMCVVSSGAGGRDWLCVCGSGSNLVVMVIRSMVDPVNGGCDEVTIHLSNGLVY